MKDRVFGERWRTFSHNGIELAILRVGMVDDAALRQISKAYSQYADEQEKMRLSDLEKAKKWPSSDYKDDAISRGQRVRASRRIAKLIAQAAKVAMEM